MFMEEQSIYSPATSSAQNILQHSQISETFLQSEINGSSKKDNLFGESRDSTISNGLTRSYFSSGVSYADSGGNKNADTSRGYYQGCSDVERSDCYQGHRRNSNHQCTRGSAFGNFGHSSQMAADSTLGNAIVQTQQQTFSAQLLPFAYYGAASNFDNFSAHPTVNLHQDQDVPLDYSKSAYSKNSFSGRFAKASMDMYPTNCFVSPGFAGLAHL